MSERKQNPQGSAMPRPFWQAIGKFTAVKWLEFSHDGDITGTFGPEALVMYAHVDADAFRDLGLSRLQPHRPGFPEFDQDATPTEDQVRRAWTSSAAARARRQRADQDLGQFSARGNGESVDQFYRRVADYYRRAVRSTGRPVKSLSDAAAVPKTTAARWVREARARGYLEQTTRGKGRS